MAHRSIIVHIQIEIPSTPAGCAAVICINVDTLEFVAIRMFGPPGRSEVVNDLIRKARELEAIRARLIAAEQSGLSSRTPEEILAATKAALRRDGEL